jgi:TorA maturation chaperone TorD
MTREEKVFLEGLKMIGSIFWGPSLEICAEMLGEPYLDRLQSLKSILPDRSIESLGQIVSTLNSFPDGESLYQHLEEGYIRLFISAKGGITAPLYESCYEFEGAPLMGKAVEEMKERFEAKGLSISENIKEPPDHLSIELEYLYFLLDKGWGEQDDALVAEAVEFATETMLPWVSQLQERLGTEKECLFYPLITRILVEILHVIGRLSIDY